MSFFKTAKNELVNLSPSHILNIKEILKDLNSDVKDEKYLSLPREIEHLNPLLMYLRLKVPRFQAGEFYNFSLRMHANTIKNEYSEDDLSTIKTLFNFVVEKNDNRLFMIGPYSNVAFYTSQISDEKGKIVLGSNYSLAWEALCPNPYTGEILTDEFPEFDLYRDYPECRWLENPMSETGIDFSSLQWIRIYSQQPKKKSPFVAYLGTERPQPDYSRERFLENYIGILIAYLMNLEFGFGMFEIVWPVNDYAYGLIGLIGVLYSEVKFTKPSNTPEDHPTIIVYGLRKKELDEEDLKIILDINNFDAIITKVRKSYVDSFASFLESQKSGITKRLNQLKMEKVL